MGRNGNKDALHEQVPKTGEDENRVQVIGTKSIHTSLISYINQWAHMRMDEIKWVLNNNQNKVTDVSMGKLKQSQTGPQQKSLKKEIWACLLPTNKNHPRINKNKRRKKLPVEVNEKSTINIPENNPLQLGWPEIGKPSFFFSWPPS